MLNYLVPFWSQNNVAPFLIVEGTSNLQILECLHVDKGEILGIEGLFELAALYAALASFGVLTKPFNDARFAKKLLAHCAFTRSQAYQRDSLTDATLRLLSF